VRACATLPTNGKVEASNATPTCMRMVYSMACNSSQQVITKSGQLGHMLNEDALVERINTKRHAVIRYVYNITYGPGIIAQFEPLRTVHIDGPDVYALWPQGEQHANGGTGAYILHTTCLI
jgi:hypothetical protein